MSRASSFAPLRRRLSRLLLAAVVLAGCGGHHDASDADLAATLLAAPLPAEHARGEQLFQVHCSACHGPRASGADQGPPLVHIVYEPSHHADIAFFLAVERGVRAHHWRYGDMPPIPAVTREETAEIIAYIRWLQRYVGIE